MPKFSRDKVVKIPISETDIKRQVKDYLHLKGIVCYHNLQGVGCFRGLPDMVMHFNRRVHYLEIKKPGGKLSDYQVEFQRLCKEDKIYYHIITCMEDLIAITG